MEAALATERLAHAAERDAHAKEREERKKVEAERDRLRAAFDKLKIETDLAKHRITIAKAERIDTTQLEIEFATKLAELDELAGMVSDPAINAGVTEAVNSSTPSSPSGGGKVRRKGTGRRDLNLTDLPEERIEVPDPALDAIAERIGFEESLIIGYRRGGPIRIRVARVKYKVPESVLDADLAMPGVVTAPAPLALLPKSMAAPSLIARIATEKFCWGLPLHRIEQRMALEGFPISRGTMSRWIEQAGAVIGGALIEAMRREALATAFCIATDATGILVQPTPRDDRQPQPCERAHMFVQIADADAVFFEFTPKENSEVVAELFRGFQGMIQADAKSVFNVLYRSLKGPDFDEDLETCTEVGCWSHARRKIWETAIATQSVIAREALARIMRMFQYDRAWKSLSPDERKEKRDRHLRSHVVAFFEFAEPAFADAKLEDPRGMLARALGYAVRQRGALMRFLDDGRLEMTNNHSERQLRKIATGRNAWLFVGSHDHGEAAANFLSVIATARLHQLDPEIYVRDLCRVLPHWPRARYIELAPRYWRTTRARLNAAELAKEAGLLTIPEKPLPTPTYVQREL